MSVTHDSASDLAAPDDPPETPPTAGNDASLVERLPAACLLLALGAVATGLVLRFLTRTPLWLDEALSVNIAQLPIGQIPDALRHDGHPPLYYVLLHAWMQLVGTSDVAVRALSGVFGVLTLPLAWLAGVRRGGRKLGWLAVGLFGLAPFALRYATETRMYSLVMLLVLAGYLLLDDVLRRGKDDLLRLAGIALISAALLYSHYWSLWLLGSVGLVLLWRSFRADVAVRHHARRALVALVVGGVLFAPWLPTMLYQAAHTGTPWSSAQRPTSIVAVTLGDFGGGGFRDAELIGTILAMLFVLGLFGRAVSRSRIALNLRTEQQFRYEAVVVVLTLGIGSAVAFVTASAYASRYAAVLFPIFLLVVAGGLTRFVDPRVLTGAFAVMLLLFLGGAGYNVLDQRSQARAAATAVAERVNPGDLVVYCPDQLGPAGAREMPTDVDQVVFPTLAGPEFVDWVDYAKRNDAVDPSAVAADVVDRAGPQHAIFVVWNGEYRTLEGKCEAFLDSLRLLRPPGQVVLEDGGGTYYEHESVVYFPPSA